MPDLADDPITEIGRAAGSVWNYLHEHGAMSLSRLVRELDVSRELTLQGIGWLAREGKLSFQQTQRGRLISLR